MRAVVVDRFGGPESATVQDVPVPVTGPGQVRITVIAAAVNPVDLVTRAGLLAETGLHAGVPVRLGWDVAGIVEEIGPQVRRLRVGQHVIGLSDRLDAASKTHADLVVLDEQAVAAAPDGLDACRLALLPLAGLTALQALQRADVRRGQWLLVTGAAGAVGSIATQLALLDGIHVLGAGRAHHRVQIESHGAQFVDSTDLARSVRNVVPAGVDAAIDGANLALASLDAVRNGGSHISLTVLDRPAPLRGINTASVAVRADWKQLTLLGGLLAAGALHLPTPEVHPLANAHHAYRHAATPPRRRNLIIAGNRGCDNG